jgi:hypothetical protein
VNTDATPSVPLARAAANQQGEQANLLRYQLLLSERCIMTFLDTYTAPFYKCHFEQLVSFT